MSPRDASCRGGPCGCWSGSRILVSFQEVPPAFMSAASGARGWHLGLAAPQQIWGFGGQKASCCCLEKRRGQRRYYRTASPRVPCASVRSVQSFSKPTWGGACNRWGLRLSEESFSRAWRSPAQQCQGQLRGLRLGVEILFYIFSMPLTQECRRWLFSIWSGKERPP